LKYSEQETELPSGTTLFLYTDGLTEAENEKQELFGKQRVTDAVKAAKGSTQELLKAVTDAVHQYVGDTEQSDDLTLLALKKR
jgi:sigma-B regulation protein RsbU (phosphoserine phosphatase)